MLLDSLNLSPVAELTLKVLPIVVGIIGSAIAIYHILEKRFLRWPKIQIEIKGKVYSKISKGGLSINLSGSELNMKAFQNIQWEFRISLENVSRYDAQKIRLIEPNKEKTTFDPPIEGTSLLTTDYMEHYLEYCYKAVGDEKNALSVLEIMPLPMSKIILEYTNDAGTKFYTIATVKLNAKSKVDSDKVIVKNRYVGKLKAKHRSMPLEINGERIF